MQDDQFTLLRQYMVQIIAAHAHHASQQIGKDAIDGRVLEIMSKVPRHEFVPYELRPGAYFDMPLPIGFDKTISQPFMVALMTDLLDVREDSVVLEVGTGLGYHAAVMSSLAAKLYSVEIVEELATQAKKNLGRLGYKNITTRIGDGSRGWPEFAPFDRILVAAAVELIPPTLLQQLKPGGRMVIPTGIPESQQLMLVEKGADGRLRTKEILPVVFAKLEMTN
jgi:protein-L-isoaspartate(D-aspartate) O-methyltransferase